MVRLSGRRTVTQLTPFDLLVVVVLSKAVSNGLSGGDDSLAGRLIIVATLIVLHAGLDMLAAGSDRMEKLLAQHRMRPRS